MYVQNGVRGAVTEAPSGGRVGKNPSCPSVGNTIVANGAGTTRVRARVLFGSFSLFFSFFRHWEILVVELAHHGAIGIERRARVRISNVGDPAHRQLKPPAGHQSDAGKNNETALNSESVSVGRLHTTVSVSRLV